MNEVTVPSDLAGFWVKHCLSVERLFDLLSAAKMAEESEEQQIKDGFEWETYDRANNPGYGSPSEPLTLEGYRDEYFSYDPKSSDDEAAYGFLRLIRG